MASEIHVSLIIEEDSVDSRLLTLLNEISPTNSWLAGESRGRSNVRHQNNGCAFSIQPVESLNTENVIGSFWNFIEQEKTGLLKIIREYNLAPVLSVAVYVTEVMPSIHLEPSTLNKLSLFNIGIDIDIILST